MEACLEVVANTVLDSTQSITVSSLCARANVDISIAKEACALFIERNSQKENIEPVYIAVQKIDAPNTDPRTRVISLQYAHPTGTANDCKEIYGIYAYKAITADEDIRRDLISNALWTEELQIRSQLFSDNISDAETSEMHSYRSSYVAGSVGCKIKNAVEKDSKSSMKPLCPIDTKEAEPDEMKVSLKIEKDLPERKNTPQAKTRYQSSALSGKAPKTATEPRKHHVAPKVLSIDSSSDEDDETPAFVPKRKGRIIEMEEERPIKVRKTEPKANTHKQSSKNAKDERSMRSDTNSITSSTCSETTSDEKLPRKQKKVVLKTRITEDGYMITESNLEEVDVPSDEGSSKVTQDNLMSSNNRAPKKPVKKNSASQPAKQKSLLSFFKKS